MTVNFLKKLLGKYSRKRAAGGSLKPRDLKGVMNKMSVIGRLDKQVEEVLIAPIARRHEQQNKERENEKQASPEEAQQTATKKEQQGNSE